MWKCRNFWGILDMWQQFSVRILASPTLPPKKSFALAEASYSPFLCCSPDKKKGYQSESQRSASILVIYGLRPVNKSIKLWTAAVSSFWHKIKMLIFGARKNAWLIKNLVRKCQKQCHTYCTFLRLQGTLIDKLRNQRKKASTKSRIKLKTKNQLVTTFSQF